MNRKGYSLGQQEASRDQAANTEAYKCEQSGTRKHKSWKGNKAGKDGKKPTLLSMRTSNI